MLHNTVSEALSNYCVCSDKHGSDQIAETAHALAMAYANVGEPDAESEFILIYIVSNVPAQGVVHYLLIQKVNSEDVISHIASMHAYSVLILV